MYYIVEITPQGSETFLEGFEKLGEVWDVVSRLQRTARLRAGTYQARNKLEPEPLGTALA